MLLKDKFITPFLQLIKALIVNIKGICLHSLVIGSVFKTIKSVEYMNFSTQTNKSSVILFGILINLPMSKIVVEVGFNLPKLSSWYTE